MKINIKEIENRNSSNEGTWGTFFYKGEKYTGIIFDLWGDKVNWIFEVKEGLQNGIEKTFYEGSNDLEQIVEYKDNVQHGISKEYDEQGNLTSVSILWNDKVLKTLFIEDFSIVDKEIFYDLNESKYPEEIEKLLNLSDEELIAYKFKEIAD